MNIRISFNNKTVVIGLPHNKNFEQFFEPDLPSIPNGHRNLQNKHREGRLPT